MKRTEETIFRAAKPAVNSNLSPAVRVTKYAGLWQRLAAYIIDILILWCFFMVIGIILYVVFGVKCTGKTEGLLIGLLYMLYFAGMESSSKMSTIGKMCLGLKVTDYNGNKISIQRAVCRYLCKALTSITLGLGYIPILFTKKKKSLHDFVAETCVISVRKSQKKSREKAMVNAFLSFILMVCLATPASASSNSNGVDLPAIAKESFHDVFVYDAPHIIPEAFNYIIKDPYQDIKENYAHGSVIEATGKSIVGTEDHALGLCELNTTFFNIAISAEMQGKADKKIITRDQAEEITNQMQSVISGLNVVGSISKHADTGWERLSDIELSPFEKYQEMLEAEKSASSAGASASGNLSSQAQPAAYTTKSYTNARFQFTIEYPGFLTHQEFPENGDGIKLSTPDGSTILTVSGINNILSYTPSSYYNRILKKTYENKDNFNTSQDKNGITISWVEEDKTFYRKVIVGSGSIDSFEIEYPSNQNSFYNPIISRLTSSFKTPKDGEINPGLPTTSD